MTGDPATNEGGRPAGGKPRLWLVLLPLVAFLALAVIFMMQLTSGRDGRNIPSPLIGHATPVTDLAPLEGTGLPGLLSANFNGRVTLVNIWGSWCVPCREEHPLLLELSKDNRFVLAGFNYKDKPENALRFLGELGNPFDEIGVDPSGREAIDWGVYGVPETYLIGKDGTILYKHVGPFTEDSIRDELMPEIDKALAAS